MQLICGIGGINKYSDKIKAGRVFFTVLLEYIYFELCNIYVSQLCLSYTTYMPVGNLAFNSNRYSIDWKSDLDSLFYIDPVIGTISTNELLDRESTVQHNISVVATKVSKYALNFPIFPISNY